MRKETMTTIRTLLTACAALVVLAGFTSLASAQSAADPNGQTPLGVEEKSGAKGPALAGVIVLELINVSETNDQADSARVVVRLRRGSHLETIFKVVPGPLFFGTSTELAAFQATVLGAFRNTVLFLFFDNDCGNAGDDCVLVLKQADEFGLTSDGDFNQFVVMDLTVSLAAPPAP
jgi:hypothetical protein